MTLGFCYSQGTTRTPFLFKNVNCLHCLAGQELTGYHCHKCFRCSQRDLLLKFLALSISLFSSLHVAQQKLFKILRNNSSISIYLKKYVSSHCAKQLVLAFCEKFEKIRPLL